MEQYKGFIPVESGLLVEMMTLSEQERSDILIEDHYGTGEDINFCKTLISRCDEIDPGDVVLIGGIPSSRKVEDDKFFIFRENVFGYIRECDENEWKKEIFSRNRNSGS